MPVQNETLEQRLKAQAAQLGFAACAIARADAAPRTAERLRQWLEAGHHGDMLWMEERAEQRGSPTGLWPEARSVIMLGMSYAPGRDPLALAEVGDRGRISVYAQGRDYHDVVKKALKALARWLVDQQPTALKVFVDTAPVMEKPLAQGAGLGWQGKHSNLVSRQHGSWLFLGVIYTEIALEPDAPEVDHCGSCTACLSSCPTDAFPSPYIVDARRCISYLTIEHKGPIPEEFRARMGTASMAATIAWRPAPGTSLRRGQRPTAPSSAGRSWRHRRWATCWTWTMRAFARFSPGRRSSGSGATGWCAMRRSRRAIAATCGWSTGCGG